VPMGGPRRGGRAMLLAGRPICPAKGLISATLAVVSGVIRSRAGDEIRTVDDWGRLAKPAHESHWKDGRSAKELAKAWVAGEGQKALVRLFDSHTDLQGLAIESAVAEEQVAFDGFPGGRRNHDLLVRGRCAHGPVVVGLEAKADETFGQTVARYQSDALAVREAGKTTNAPERLTALLDDIGAILLERTTTFGDLRYQLFSGVAGTLAAAETGDLAAFVVHELTPLTSDKKREENKRALAEFVGDVTGAIAPDKDWWLLGPFYVPARRWSQSPLYIGHLTTTG
jgi:hypothetical protein